MTALRSPNSSGHPRLNMVIEPENNFRFRYDSESGSHGGIPGKKTEIAQGKAKKIYPTVKLENYHSKKPVLIRASLCTENREPHVLELAGKQVSEDGMCYVELDNDLTAKFTNLVIRNKKKEDAHKILMERKMLSLGYQVFGAAKRKLEKSFEREVKEKAKEILCSAVLCFEAFTKDNLDVPICQPLYSKSISNQKTSLRIHRMSRCAGSWKGNDEVILLCDKVKKDEIEILFFEKDDTDSIIWNGKGTFSPAEVHHQVAIPFKTPQYREDAERKVFVCLCQNDDRSDSVEFVYTAGDDDLMAPLKKRKRSTVTELKISQDMLFNLPLSPGSSSNDTSLDNIMIEMNPSLKNENISDPYLPVLTDVQCSNSFQGPEMHDSLQVSETVQSLSHSPETSESVDSLFYDMSCDLFEAIRSLDPDIGSILETDFINTNYMQTDGARFLPQLMSIKDDILVSEQKFNYFNDAPVGQMDESGSNAWLTSKITKMSCNEETVKENKTTECSFRSTRLQGEMLVISRTEEEPKEKEGSEIHLNNKLKAQKMCFQILSKRDNMGNTLLHLAVLHNKNVKNILKMIKFSNSEILNAQNNNKQTAVHLATEQNNVELVMLLCLNGGNPDLKNGFGDNCYHIAARNKSINCLKVLLHCHASGIDDFNYQGWTPLHITVMKKPPKNSIECLCFLLSLVDVNAQDKKSGRSPLHFATEMESGFISTLLLNPNIDVNRQDFSGDTPLHVACSLGHFEIAMLLLKAGADPLIKNFKRSYRVSDEESSEDESDCPTSEISTCNLEDISENKAINGQTAFDVSTDKKIIELLTEAIKGRDTYSDHPYDDTTHSSKSVEDKICRSLDDHLDLADWRSLVMCLGMDDYALESILKCSSSPANAVVQNFLKKNFKENYIEVLQNALEMAELHNALKNVKEIHSS